MIGGKVVKAHKFVIQGQCGAFYRAIALHDCNAINLDNMGISFEVFSAFIKYLYFDKIDEEIDVDEIVFGLLDLVVKFDLFSLKCKCEEYLQKTIRKRNAIRYLIKAHKLNATSVKDKAIDLVRDNLGQLDKTQGYDDFIKNQELLNLVFSKKQE